MDKGYGGVIWTNHVLQRLRERGIKQGDAWAAWRNPDTSEYEPRKGVWVYKRTFNGEKIEVVAKKNDRGKWIVLSVWSKSVSSGKSSPGKIFFSKILRKLLLLKK